MNERKSWPPVIAGIVIGLAMLATFYVAGRGFGASGAVTRVAVTIQDLTFPELTESSGYFGRFFAHGRHPLNGYLVYMMVGILSGSFVAALTGRDLKLEVLRGPNSTWLTRLWFAFFGGMFIGFAARLARGCTSGLALVGGAELSIGAWLFMLAIFAGGFAGAYWVRRQWL